MSQENTAIIDALYEAFNGEDFPDGVVRYMDHQVVLHPGLLPPGEGTQYLGHEGVMEWLGNVTDAWVAVTVEPNEKIEVASDRILSIDRWRFTGRDGIQVEEELPTAYTFRNGLIVRVDGFTDKDEALAAVGLSE